MARTSTVDEPALVRRLSEDLDASFVAFVKAFEETVFTTALRMTNSHDGALDVSADTFLRAYRALQGYDTKRIRALQLRSWLVTITLNLCRNELRRQARRPEQLVDVVPERSAVNDGPEQAVERSEAQRALAKRLFVLPERQRAAVVLRHIAGLSYEEMARALKRPQATVRSDVARGLQRLRAGFGNDVDEKEER